MFRRRRSADPSPAPSPDGPRDEALPMLSVAQAVALTDLACAAFARHGTPVQPAGPGVVGAADGRVYGLHNLAVAIAPMPHRDWDRAVDHHARAMLATNDAASAGAGSWLLKVRAFSDLPEPVDYDATSPLPGIAALPAVDLPTHVSELLGLARVREHAELDAFRDRAFANLRALPAPEHTVVRADDARTDTDVHVFASDDFFGASRVLVLDHLLASALRVERPPHGVLVAVPNRHLLAVHLVTGMGVISALQLLVRIAEGEHASRPGPVSDDVFHLPGGGGLGQRLTQRDDGEIRVVVDGPFAEVLAGLGDGDRPPGRQEM